MPQNVEADANPSSLLDTLSVPSQGDTAFGANSYVDKIRDAFKSLLDNDTFLNNLVQNIGPTDPPMVVLQRSTPQSIASGGFTPVQFDVEAKDTDGFANLATNNTRITIPTGLAGWYLLLAEGDFAASNVGQRQWTFGKNGSIYKQSAMIPATITIRHSIPISTLTYLEEGDYIEFCVYQDAGISLNIGDGRSLYPQMVAIRQSS